MGARLAPQPEAFDELKETHLARMSGRREQYKHCFVVNEIDYHKKLPVRQTVALAGENDG